MAKTPTIRFVDITPEIAKRWLEDPNNPKNRPYKPTRARKFAEAMRRGEWSANGEAIMRNSSGGLLNGQHRLNAVVISGRVIPMAVAEGLDNKAFDTIDQGYKRTVGDAFSVHGESNAKHLSTAVRWASLIQKQMGLRFNPGRGALTNPQALDFVRKYPDIRDCLKFTMQHELWPILSYGVSAGLLWHCRKKHRATADWFFSAIGSGAGLKVGDSPLSLRKRLIRERALDGERMNTDVKGLLTLKAWNCWRMDEDYNARLLKADWTIRVE